ALRQVSFALPEGQRGAGEFKVQITADYYKQVFEHNAAGDAEANNIGQVSFTASLAGYPDLIASVSVAAGVLESGKPMTIQWEITNRGDAPAVGSFSHRLQVTNATTGASVYSKVYRYDVEAGGAIQPGGSRQFEQTITLPDGTLGSGELIVRVTADHYNDIYEYTADGM